MKTKIYNSDNKELDELEYLAIECGHITHDMEYWKNNCSPDRILEIVSGFKQTIEERNFLCRYMNSIPCLVGFKCPFPADEEHCDKDTKIGHGQICWLEVAHREIFNTWKTYSSKEPSSD